MTHKQFTISLKYLFGIIYEKMQLHSFVCNNLKNEKHTYIVHCKQPFGNKSIENCLYTFNYSIKKNFLSSVWLSVYVCMCDGKKCHSCTVSPEGNEFSTDTQTLPDAIPITFFDIPSVCPLKYRSQMIHTII